MAIISHQRKLSKSIPENVLGNAEYWREHRLLEKMDQVLKSSGLDDAASLYFIQEAKKDEARRALQTYRLPKPLSKKAKIMAQDRGVFSLRIAVLSRMLNLSCRDLSKQLALAELYQWFCQVNRFTAIEVPSKSKINALINQINHKFLKDLNVVLMTYCIDSSGLGKPLKLEHSITSESCYFDTFCQKTNIHYPVDWVLLRDASRTLMKLIQRIRKHSVNRMEFSIESLMTRMNNLCIEMTHSKRVKGGKKIRKRCFRDMKLLSNKIAKHARKHIEKLYVNRSKVGLSDAEIQVLLHEVNVVLMQLPKAIAIGHKRIISEKEIENEEKILSLYEDGVNVVVRKKVGSTVEFGNQAVLLEQGDGFILDWDLVKDGAPSDHLLCRPSYDRVCEAYGLVKSLTTDRGCYSKKTSKHLKAFGTYDATCPKGVDDLREKRKEPDFCKHQKRRGSTEARISILKNFTGGRLKCKGFLHREQKFGLCILTHNLWKIGRMLMAYEDQKRREKTKTA